MKEDQTEEDDGGADGAGDAGGAGGSGEQTKQDPEEQEVGNTHIHMHANIHIPM